MSSNAARQVVPFPSGKKVPVPDPFQTSVRPQQRDVARAPERVLSLREGLLLGLLALSLHGVVLYGAAGWKRTPALIEPPEVPPMVIDFTLAPPPAPVVEEVPEPPPPPPEPDPLPAPPPPVDELAVRPPPEPTPEPPPAPEPPPPEPLPVPPPAPTAEPAPAPVTPPSADAGYLRNPAPSYPAVAQRRGWEGTVQLSVHVLTSGRPSEIQIAASSGHDLLDDAAVRAVRRWTFVPAKQGGREINGWVTVPVTFQLN